MLIRAKCSIVTFLTSSRGVFCNFFFYIQQVISTNNGTLARSFPLHGPFFILLRTRAHTCAVCVYFLNGSSTLKSTGFSLIKKRLSSAATKCCSSALKSSFKRTRKILGKDKKKGLTFLPPFKKEDCA